MFLYYLNPTPWFQLENKGHASVTDVEFFHTGQLGWSDYYDPRYSLAFLDIGEVTTAEPSLVKGCSFHNGFSPALGVFGTDNLVFRDNVVHHTVGPGILLTTIQVTHTILLHTAHGLEHMQHELRLRRRSFLEIF